MKPILLIAVSILMAFSTLASSARAEVLVLRGPVQVICSSDVDYFYWRSFSGRLPGPSNRLMDVYASEPMPATSLNRSGFQSEPTTNCQFKLGRTGFANDAVWIDVLSEQWSAGRRWDDEFGPYTDSAELRINGISVLIIDQIWSPDEWVEHVIEIVNETGKHCEIKYDAGGGSLFDLPTSGITEPIDQTMSCRFFRLPEPETETVEEGR